MFPCGGVFDPPVVEQGKSSTEKLESKLAIEACSCCGVSIRMCVFRVVLELTIITDSL
jgi:hypothetical protein